MALLLPACRERAFDVQFRDSELHAFTAEERDLIRDVADRAGLEVRALLPMLPPKLRLRVQAGRDVIPETGETGSAVPPDGVEWIVDPDRPGGVSETTRRELRSTLFHELHHAVRRHRFKHETLMDTAVTEGLATAFERDQTGAPAPWGVYPEEVQRWVGELQAVSSTASREAWMFHHPDGRRWIGYKVGTYLADQAALASGRSPAALVLAPTEEILALAGRARRPSP